jgi:hypothetical protein
VATDDIYVQITASSESSGKSRTVVVRVPRARIEKFRQEKDHAHANDDAVAKALAEPLANYAFTHRTIFSSYKLAHSFSPTPPPDIEGKSPNVSQAGLKAWVLS